MLLYTCEVLNKQTEETVPNILLYISYKVSGQNMEVYHKQLMANKSKADQVSDVVKIKYVKVGNSIMAQLESVIDESKVEILQNIPQIYMAKIHSCVDEESKYGSSPSLDLIRKALDSKKTETSVGASTLIVAIENVYNYQKETDMNHKPYIEFSTDLASDEVKSYYDIYKLSVVSDGINNIQTKSAVQMKNCEDKIYFPVHSIDSIMLEDTEELNIPSYIKPYGKNREFGDPDKWVEVAKREKAGNLIAGAPNNNNTEIKPNEVDFYGEFTTLFDSFIKYVGKVREGVGTLNPADISECKMKAPKETKALLEYLRQWIDVAAMVNWTHTGRVVVPGETVAQYNLFDFIPSADLAESLRYQLDVDDERETDDSEAVTDDVVIFREEDSNNNQSVMNAIYISNFTNTVELYIRNANSLYAYAEAIVKLFRWGSAKPTKLKLQGMSTYFNLSTCTEDSFSGCIEDYSRIVFDADGHTRRIYRVISNICTASKPLDTPYFVENDLVTTSIPLGVVLFEQLKETGGLNFIFVDYITFVEKFDALGVAGVKKVNGRLIADLGALQKFEEMDSKNNLDTQLGESNELFYKHVIKTEMRRNSDLFGVDASSIDNIANTEPYINDLMVDTNMCILILNNLKTDKSGETRDVVQVPRKHMVSRQRFTKKITGFYEDSTPITADTDIVAYVNELNKQGMGAYTTVEDVPLLDENENPMFYRQVEDYIDSVDHFYSIYSTPRINSKSISYGHTTVGSLNMITVLCSFIKYKNLEKLISFSLKTADERAKLQSSGLIETSNEVAVVENMQKNSECFLKLNKHYAKKLKQSSSLSYQEVLDIWSDAVNDILDSENTETPAAVTQKQSLMSQPVVEKIKLDAAFTLQYNGRLYGYVGIEPVTSRKIFCDINEVVVTKAVPTDKLGIDIFLKFLYAQQYAKDKFDAQAKEMVEGSSMKKILKEVYSKNPNDITINTFITSRKLESLLNE